MTTTKSKAAKRRAPRRRGDERDRAFAAWAVRRYSEAMDGLRGKPARDYDSLEALLDEALYFFWLYAKHGTFVPTVDEKAPGARDQSRRSSYRFLREVEGLSQVDALDALAEREGVSVDAIRSSLYRDKRPTTQRRDGS
ncbi:MAG: hypothetical protein IT519_15075 [Burkholderiales bacterium]|nr:hypothetical protein [Burkholderiales bacterium]